MNFFSLWRSGALSWKGEQKEGSLYYFIHEEHSRAPLKVICKFEKHFSLVSIVHGESLAESHAYSYNPIRDSGETMAYNNSDIRAIIVYFDTRGQNGRLAHCKCENAARAVSESPVWPHVSNHIFLYKFMRTRVRSPFTDIENAPQLNFTH